MILIIKTGSTFDSIKRRLGDFENWIINTIGKCDHEIEIFNSGDYSQVPAENDYSGIIITGSHDMVTDFNLAESKLGKWLLAMQNDKVPILGICYGHQLLSVLNGGQVGYNKTGIQIGAGGTILTEQGKNDPLFGVMPSGFQSYKSHQQSILEIPVNSTVLAYSKNNLIDAVRFAPSCWGAQFHPEFDEEVMRRYIKYRSDTLREEGIGSDNILIKTDSPGHGIRLLRRFVELIDLNLKTRTKPGRILNNQE